jgi:hypothetical protein
MYSINPLSGNALLIQIHSLFVFQLKFSSFFRWVGLGQKTISHDCPYKECVSKRQSKKSSTPPPREVESMHVKVKQSRKTPCVTLLVCKKLFFVSILPLAVHGRSDTPPVVMATVAAVGVSPNGHTVSGASNRCCKIRISTCTVFL